MLTIKDLKQILEDFDDDRYVYCELCNTSFVNKNLENVNGYKRDRHGDLRLTLNEIQKEL